MWIMTNYGVLMLAELPAEHRPRHTDFDLQVRSRDRATLTRLRKRMKDAGYVTSAVQDTRHKDYEWRIYTRKCDYADFIAGEVLAVNYEKFKPTTERRGGGGPALHDLYNEIWYVMARFYDSPILRPRKVPARGEQASTWQRMREADGKDVA